MPNNKFISMQEAVELTGYTDGRLRQLLRAKELSGEKFSERVWMIDRSDALRLKRGRKHIHQKAS